MSKKNVTKKKEKSISCYKGFNRDMTCKDFQFEEGKSYHIDDVEICKSGFHACPNPWDVFRYYDNDTSIYHKVRLSGNFDYADDMLKVCASDIEILEEVSVSDIIELSANYIRSKLGEYQSIIDKRIGIVNSKEDFNKILDSTEIYLGNRILLMDGEYNYDWTCIDKKLGKDGKYEYSFVMDTPILDRINPDFVEYFKDSELQKCTLNPLADSLSEILGDRMISRNIDDNGINYDTKITILSREDVNRDSGLYYFRLMFNFGIYPYHRLSRSDCWLRSVVSSSLFAYVDGDGLSYCDGASHSRYVRPQIFVK